MHDLQTQPDGLQFISGSASGPILKTKGMQKP
jgi:hypothetical protein